MHIELSKSLDVLLKLEELMIFIGSVILYSVYTSYAWWIYAILFFLPDISIALYSINNRTGAIAYNLLHHQGVMIALSLVGIYFQIEWLTATGIVFLGHSGFDRIFGYGLKFPDNFKHTHLGWLNQKNTA